MIYYNLPNGKTVRFTDVFALLESNDQELMARNSGVEISSPFHDSALGSGGNEEELYAEEFGLDVELPSLDDIEEVDLDEDLD